MNERWRNRSNSKERERKEKIFYNMDEIVLMPIRYSLISFMFVRTAKRVRRKKCFYDMNQIVLISIRYSLISSSSYKCETPYKFISRFQTCIQLGLIFVKFLEEYVYMHFLS